MNSIGIPMGNASQYVPPKMWKDLTADEKLERMREIVKSFEGQIISERSRVNDLENDLNNHAHLDGKVVKDIKIHNDFSGITSPLKASYDSEAKGEVYF